MGSPSLLSWFRILIALPAAASLLCSCAGSYFFEDMRAEYQPAEIPAVFASGKRGWVASGFILGNNQDPIRFQRRDSVWWATGDSSRFFRGRYDSFPGTPGILEGRYSIERSRILAGGSLAYQRRHWFCGISLAQGALTGLGQIGGFGGWSQPIGRWVPLFAGGVYANRVRTTGKVWNEKVSLPIGENGDPPGFFPDTAQGGVLDYSMPIRTGVQYRFYRDFAAYFTLASTAVSVWPEERYDTGRYGVWNTDVALGAGYSPIADIIVGLELALTSVDGPDFYSGDAAKVGITLERAWR